MLLNSHNHLKIGVLALLLLYIASAHAQSKRGVITGTTVNEYPTWFKDSFLDIEDDLNEASESGKHLILFLDLNGCPYCYKMIEENFKYSPFKQYIQNNFDVIGLNVKGDREIVLDAETTVTEKKLAELMDVKFTPGLIFLNTDNEVVAKVNGYRSVKDFKIILDYVKLQEYKNQTLASYVNERDSKDIYELRDDPLYDHSRDLTSSKDKPVAFIFEDTKCNDCQALHDGHLAAPEVRDVLGAFTVMRIDTRSDELLTLFNGTKISEREFAESLNVSYTPTIVLFDHSKEKLRIDSMLYRFHFIGLLDYIGGRHYVEFPNSPFDYIAKLTEERLSAGENVNIAE